MEPRRIGTVLSTVIAYVFVTFAVQGASHFGINAAHYAAIPIFRADPMIPLGIASMLVQGTIFALLFPTFNRGARPIRNGVVFSLAIGGFLASYIVFAEAGKYAIPSIASWIVVEGSAALVQYTVFGIALGLIHRRSAAPVTRIA